VGFATVGTPVWLNCKRYCLMADFAVILPRGFHPFPSRTRKLSPAGPIVLCEKVYGRVGRRRIKTKAPFRNEWRLIRFWSNRKTSLLITRIELISADLFVRFWSAAAPSCGIDCVAQTLLSVLGSSEAQCAAL